MCKRIVFFLATAILAGSAAASVSEIEPNDGTGTAFPLPSTDEAVGQLNGPEDADVFYIDVTDTLDGKRMIPVYFGCNKKLDAYYTDGATVAEEDDKLTWSVKYLYQTTPGDTPVLQSDYIFQNVDCKQGTADITGPLRFQMNATRAGRYLIVVTGNFTGTKVIQVPQPDGTTKDETIDTWIANTADYTLRAITAPIAGELEPNNGMLEAYPLTTDSTVTAQLYSMYDEDWFYIQNSAASPGRVTSVYMSCSAGSSGANGENDPLFLVSTFDPNGNLQSSYEVGAARCTADGGFKFSVNTPSQGNYYVLVSAPTYLENTRYSDLDYKLSQFYQINDTGGGGSGSFTGTIRKATITDNGAAGKDRFNIVLNNCNSGGVGNLTLSGNKLDFPALAETMQVKVQVGSWSCLTDTASFFVDATKANRTIYKYPSP